MASHDRPQAAGAARAEYLARIHRVMDHIERHLGERLSLEDAGRAWRCFSPFHFHRVFTACAGESLYQFILRLRLERAANQLLQNPRKSITAIALDCGFGGSAAFARAFRAGFGVSASEWRAGGSKNRETIRKDGEEPDATTATLPPVPPRSAAGGDDAEEDAHVAHPSSHADQARRFRAHRDDRALHRRLRAPRRPLRRGLRPVRPALRPALPVGRAARPARARREVADASITTTPTSRPRTSCASACASRPRPARSPRARSA